MTFNESVKSCFAQYATFKGCASRSEYWWWILFCWIVTAALSMLSENAVGAFQIATLLPSVAVGARRLHDTDRSGWRQLFWLLPLVGWVLLFLWFSQKGNTPNRFCDGCAG